MGMSPNVYRYIWITGRRRRSSLFQSLTSLASVALVSAMGTVPHAEKDNVSSSSDSEDDQKDMDVQIDVKNKKTMSREDSMESGVVSYTPNQNTPSTGQSNRAFQYDEDTLSKLERRDSVSTFRVSPMFSLNQIKLLFNEDN